MRTARAAIPASSRRHPRFGRAPIAIIELVDRDPAAKGQDSGPVMTDDADMDEAA
jgi:hypothetical protein